ncbi:MAG: 30S ribosomal protein S21 [Nitrospirae bacterium]|nr:30S ribosomal protein S21 [Nitrospirota bacterium]
MPGIKVQQGEPLEVALKRFKRQIERAEVLSEIKRREHYDKPSVRRKKKSIAARKKRHRRRHRS